MATWFNPIKSLRIHCWQAVTLCCNQCLYASLWQLLDWYRMGTALDICTFCKLLFLWMYSNENVTWNVWSTSRKSSNNVNKCYLGMLRLKLLLRWVNRIESCTSNMAPFLAAHGGAFAPDAWNELFCWKRPGIKSIFVSNRYFTTYIVHISTCHFTCLNFGLLLTGFLGRLLSAVD